MPVLAITFGLILLLVLICLLGFKILGIRSRNHPPAKTGTAFLPYDPGTPNYISSMASNPERHVEPLPIKGDPDTAWQTLQEIVSSQPRTKVIHSSSSELHAEVTSRFFGFVDDLIFILDGEENQIHLRSSSRVGYSDMGANAERIHQLRSKWEKSELR